MALGCAGAEEGGEYTKLIVFPPDKVTAKVPVKEVNPAVFIVKLLVLNPEILLPEIIGQV